MTRQNQELVDELERFSEQDEQVRGILNRRNRVSDLKIRSESNLKQSVNAIREASTSPKKQHTRTSSVRRSPYK